ncbi:MAG: SDR family oxidoreductase [Hyphomicrobiaceae bacterium]|nr:SDR family oxidoreductase [Hyphomicrobiaceae bacterium]
MDKTAIVTGAGSGIGRATAVRLAENGFRVVMAGRNLARLEETAGLCPQTAQTLAVAVDVGIEEDVVRLFDEAVQTFGHVDVVFNNAGIGMEALPVEETPLATFETVVRTNLVGAFLVAREAVRRMKAQKPQGGRIINNGSISAYVPRPNAVAYNMTKHAVLGLTKSVALEGRAFNIACGEIDIGNTATDMTAAMASGKLQANGTIAPEPTFDVRHVADAIVYMANLPLDTNVLSMNVMATAMPYVGRG